MRSSVIDGDSRLSSNGCRVGFSDSQGQKKQWPSFIPLAVLCGFLAYAADCVALAQQVPTGRRPPHLGYVYPAGGQAGTSFDVVVGGQYLDGIRDVIIAPLNGEGQASSQPRATFVKLIKPLTQKQANDLAEKLREVQEKVRAEIRQRRLRSGMEAYRELFVKFAAEAGISEEMLKALEEFRKLRNDPKRQPNPQIAERATIHVTLPPDTAPGFYVLRVATGSGLSDPVRFHVTAWKEVLEVEPNDQEASSAVDEDAPVVLNGQILPGDVDRFRLKARKGQKLVMAVLARALTPYLADAVPGWFQATLRVLDGSGRELAYVDDYWFQPDPVLLFDVPGDGEYILEIKDAIFRGREDFTYRIVVGEIPFITSVFPAGGQLGSSLTLELTGWNLPESRMTLMPLEGQPGIRTVVWPHWASWMAPLPLAVSEWADVFETEPNDQPQQAQPIAVGTVVNARIERAGDRDVFQFSGRQGEVIVAEVVGRRVFSPIDSFLRLLGPKGQVLASNDDFEDKTAGLVTHQADSFLQVALPEDGHYLLEVTDAQRQGGPNFVYRLRVSPPRPDFELRVVPSVVNATAGSVVPVEVYAARRDGFEDTITLELGPGPSGARLSGGWIPPGQDHIVVTLTLPRDLEEGLHAFELIGKAVVNGRELVRRATPADNMMQAFYYHHLVPAERLTLDVQGRARFSASWLPVLNTPLKIPAGRKAVYRLPAAGLSYLQGLSISAGFAPEGLTVENVTRDSSGILIDLSADTEKLPPGVRGNVVLGVYAEFARPRVAPVRMQNQRTFVGWLPAIPFEIVSE